MTFARNSLFFLLISVFIIQMITMPTELYGVDAPAVRAEAQSLVSYGHLWIPDNLVRRMHKAPPGQLVIRNLRTDHWYSKYGIMNTFASALPYLAERSETASLLFWFNLLWALGSVVIAGLLYQIAAEYTVSCSTRIAYVFLVFYSTFLWNYLRAQTSEALQILFFSGFFLFATRFLRESRSPKNAVIAWFWLTALVFTKTFYLFIVPIWAVFLYWKLRQARRFLEIPQLIVAPAILICAGLGVLQWLKFGSPFLSGYHESDRGYYQVPWNLLVAARGYLFDWKRSLFVHFPLLFFSIFYGLRFFRKFPVDVYFLGAIFLSSALIIGNLARWDGEWCYGPRYFAFILPVMGFPFLFWLEDLKRDIVKKRKGSLVGAGRFLVILCLFVSVLMQWTVNLLPFSAYHFINPSIYYEVQGFNAPIFEGPLGYVDSKLLRYQGQEETLPYLSDLRSRLSPQRYRRYLEIVKLVLHQRNNLMASGWKLPRSEVDGL